MGWNITYIDNSSALSTTCYIVFFTLNGTKTYKWTSCSIEEGMKRAIETVGSNCLLRSQIKWQVESFSYRLPCDWTFWNKWSSHWNENSGLRALPCRFDFSDLKIRLSHGITNSTHFTYSLLVFNSGCKRSLTCISGAQRPSRSMRAE